MHISALIVIANIVATIKKVILTAYVYLWSLQSPYPFNKRNKKDVVM